MRSNRWAASAAIAGAAVLAAACGSSHKPAAAPTTTAAPAAGSGQGSAPTTGTSPLPTTATSVGTTAPATTTTVKVTPLSFPTPVDQALTYLQSHTSSPLAGPTSLDSPDTLSATTTVGSSRYSVALYACPTPQALNAASIAADCEFSANTKGTFGEQTYPSVAAATAALPTLSSMSDQPLSPCPAGSPVTQVVNQHVATCGHSNGPQGGPATASWTEGEWTFLFMLGGQGDTVQQDTTPLINRLNQVFLPAHPGYFSANEGGDGEHATAVWAVGDRVYSDFDYHSAVGAADMASSTRYLTP